MQFSCWSTSCCCYLFDETTENNGPEILTMKEHGPGQEKYGHGLGPGLGPGPGERRVTGIQGKLGFGILHKGN